MLEKLELNGGLKDIKTLLILAKDSKDLENFLKSVDTTLKTPGAITVPEFLRRGRIEKFFNQRKIIEDKFLDLLKNDIQNKEQLITQEMAIFINDLIIVELRTYDESKIDEAIENEYYLELKYLNQDDLKKTMEYALSKFKDLEENKPMTYIDEVHAFMKNSNIFNVFNKNSPDIDFLEAMNVESVEHYEQNGIKCTVINHKKQRANVKPGWEMPKCEVEDYKPIAFIYKNGTVELDFLSEKKADFLSEYDDLVIEIDNPFIDGYKPNKEDYEALGFTIIYE